MFGQEFPQRDVGILVPACISTISLLREMVLGEVVIMDSLLMSRTSSPTWRESSVILTSGFRVGGIYDVEDVRFG